jgi:glycosyltransferase involved in cell wall biosynthesis
MKIALFTLTRDRLEYTQYCLHTLVEKAGHPYDHFVIDNGSVDGTVEWLSAHQSNFRAVHLLPKNIGISRGSNLALTEIFKTDDYDLVVKMDNDCEVVSENILGQMVEIYSDVKEFSSQYVLSPRAEGIVNQPHRGRFTQIGGRRIGLTAIIGGLFCVIPGWVAKKYRYPEDLPVAWGQDDAFCKWFKGQGGEVGYVEGLIVNHYETTNGQAERYPDYFKRKWDEEKRS